MGEHRGEIGLVALAVRLLGLRRPHAAEALEVIRKTLAPEVSIAVVPNKRGHGHGSQLLEALMKRAREDGFGALTLSVEPDNPALKLYERLGFCKVGETGGSWTMKVDLD